MDCVYGRLYDRAGLHCGVSDVSDRKTFWFLIRNFSKISRNKRIFTTNDAMGESLISRNDLEQAIRSNFKASEVEEIEAAFLERNSDTCVIVRKNS